MISGCPIDGNIIFCLVRYEPTLALILFCLAFAGIYGIYKYKVDK